MSRLIVPEATRRAQADASDPESSVFVSANAGSGKTFVLARRVVRLLVAGAAPSKILCLTYTKAAAAEMQGRIFQILSDWTRADDGALAAALAELGGQPHRPADLARARRLFATALETPGGLKVQTIHAFCEQLLHLFPLEAGVPGHFEVMDDAESALLLAEARRRLIVAASKGSGAPLAEAFSEALSLGGEWGLDALIGEIVGKRDAIRAHLSVVGGLEGAVDALAHALGVPPGANRDDVLADLWPCPHFPPASVEALVDAAQLSGTPTDATLLKRLEILRDPGQTGHDRMAAYRALMLDSKGQPRGSIRGFATKAVAAAVPDAEERLRAAGERALAFSDRLATLALFAASRAALTIAERLELDYQSLKRARARLDFEDLIVRAADLLTASHASAWVHYKLDQGIDHVLVDEAQDTSPRQWQVVRQLVEEFFSGTLDRPRTLFAVGDEKQSIYSFQGASPTMFGQERRAIERRALDAQAPFQRVSLHQSFRSSADVLSAVDGTFEGEEDRRGLSSENEKPSHSSARGSVPGLVEIWPVYSKEILSETDDWLAPLDREQPTSPLVRLAQRIAGTIAGWIGTPIEHRGSLRPMSAGDVIVLVRKRSGFASVLSSALRARGLHVAGADRLVLTDHIAVQDLMALGRVVANSEDELSLAACLKSPLFDLTDEDLMAIALSRGHERPGSLYLALRRIADEDGGARLPPFAADPHGTAARARAAFGQLQELRRRAGFTGVFDFYARLLGPGGGRARLTARLGRDAGEPIDAFLDFALKAETNGTSDLDAFLAALETAPPTIKREMAKAGDEVRIMTVHASKGLEAPVVFLVDPGSKPFSHAHGARLLPFEAMPGLPPQAPPGFLWCPDKGLANGAVEALRAGERERAEDEYRRLLYVGMTRAADRLVVCGHAGTRGADDQSWLSRVTAALGPRCERVLDETGELIAHRYGTLPGAPMAAAAEAAAEATPVATFDLSKLARETAPPRPLVPSDPAGTLRVDKSEEPVRGSPVLFPGEPSRAIRRGTLAHRLLQALPDLPEGERPVAGARYLRSAAPEFDDAEREGLLAGVLAIVSAPRFAALFSATSRAEVGVRGSVRLGAGDWPVSGTIDRLCVEDDRILVVDYKTNRPPPRDLTDVPQGHVAQLALYRALLAPLYPGRPVEAALLFTEGPTMIELPTARMDEALAELERRRSVEPPPTA